jgi:hypothetical protein
MLIFFPSSFEAVFDLKTRFFLIIMTARLYNYKCPVPGCDAIITRQSTFGIKTICIPGIVCLPCDSCALKGYDFLERRGGTLCLALNGVQISLEDGTPIESGYDCVSSRKNEDVTINVFI